jgi:PAS domain S-box-containing protein
MCNAAELVSVGLTSEEELIGKTVFDFYPPELARLYHADDLEAIAGRPVLDREEPGTDAEGNHRWYLTIKVPLRDHAGQIIGLVGMSRDITDRKRAEEHQRQAQKLEALGTLASGIAHDFNNILLAVAGNADLAIKDLSADHPVQQSLLEIRRAAGRASDLVRRILAFTRGEVNRVPVQLQPVVEEALMLLRATLPSMIRIDTHFAAGLPPIAADGTQIHQIVMNLATNAAHAIGHRRGTIEFRLERVDVSEDMLPMVPDLRPAGYVVMTVADNGCGMDHETLSRIFDPFFTTKPPGEGTGLGLSVVHGIVKGHDGAINVYSIPGKGSTFKVYFPALDDTIRITKPEVRAPSRAKGERILYVDDEDALVLLASRMLTRLGYEVAGYSDPLEALRTFRSRPADFDVVVTDLSMPAMSGFELARTMIEIRPDVPVIMTSGYVRIEDHRTADEIGVKALILKPSTMEEFAEALAGLIAQRRDTVGPGASGSRA